MEAQGGQTTTLTSQSEVKLGPEGGDSEVTRGAWVKPGLWGQP